MSYNNPFTKQPMHCRRHPEQILNLHGNCNLYTMTESGQTIDAAIAQASKPSDMEYYRCNIHGEEFTSEDGVCPLCCEEWELLEDDDTEEKADEIMG